ncbi:PEP-CTERM sorting domain-containing protein [Oceanicoccus sp. KOV_DT_Chl]|uniref:PEP-CTERM sorting domain-containing protein n=1 Tax=Oceanicoccus sp. KOV_DT_Chl TaxID=1904639 RepID=UPI00135B3C28|nr:PEP-CTERM sorting domain-containing protein [Oceanicoccus sp. KOV_DT_Chl]
MYNKSLMGIALLLSLPINATIFVTDQLYDDADVVISFDEFELSEGEVITDQYVDYGVTFSNGGCQRQNQVVNFLCASQSSPQDLITVNFDKAVSRAGFRVTYMSSAGVQITTGLDGVVQDVFTVKCSGDEEDFSNCFGSVDWVIEVDGNIDAINFLTADNVVAFDDFQMSYAAPVPEEVPESTTVLLLLAGMLGLGATRMRRKGL